VIKSAVDEGFMAALTINRNNADALVSCSANQHSQYETSSDMAACLWWTAVQSLVCFIPLIPGEVLPGVVLRALPWSWARRSPACSCSVSYVVRLVAV
jgi:hypothetical protein